MHKKQTDRVTSNGNRIVGSTAVVLIVCLVAYRFMHRGGLPAIQNGSTKAGGQTYIPSLALLKRGNPALKEVALTIDDGPHPKYVPKILRVLREDQTHATFFVVGKKVLEHPEFVRQMLADGHNVGNHSMTHPRFITLSPDDVRKEIAGCAQAVFKATGTKMTLVRPPGLRYTSDILKIDKEMHYITVEENIAVGDFIVVGDFSWYPNSPTYPKHVADIQRNVFKQLKNGAIIVLHDMPATADALDNIIKGIHERGYTIVTIPEMLAHLPNPVVQP